MSIFCLFKISGMDVCSSFENLPLHPAIIQGLADSDYFRATKIQYAMIKNFDIGRPIILQSPNGTGKTGAYSIALLQKIASKYFSEKWNSLPRIHSGNILGMIIVHNPELCFQVAHELQCISRHLPLSISPFVSSMSLEDNWEELANTSIIVATPGIIAKFISKKKIKFYHLTGLVIDEWDKIVADSGLSHDLDQIIKKANLDPSRQIILCSSATFSQISYDELTKLCPFNWHLERNDSSEEIISSRKVHHLLCRVGSFERRIQVLIQFLRKLNFYQAIIFSNIEQLSKDAEKALYAAGFSPTLIESSAKMDQQTKLDRLAEFRDLQSRTLITTDLISRGLDVKSITLSVSLDLPFDSETFLHRIGRAGRFGGDVISLTFYKRQESKKIQKLKTDCQIGFEIYEPDSSSSFVDPSLFHPKLPPLNELQLKNYEFLKIQEQEALNNELQTNNHLQSETHESEELIIPKKLSNIPTFPYCDFNSNYWKHYYQYCQMFKPPL